MIEKIKVALTDFSQGKLLPKLALILAFGLSTYTLYVASITSGNGAELLGRAIGYVVVGIGLYAGLKSGMEK